MSTRIRARLRCLAGVTIILLTGSLWLTACSDDDKTVDYAPTDCDPIDPSMCALPYPSNLFLVEDSDTPTGVALQFGETSLPEGRSQIKPDAWDGLDGYGVSSPILFSAPNLDMSALPNEINARSSWDGEIGQAQLFEVKDDGALERVPFFAERDVRKSADESLYFLRPLVILEEGTRYIVMLRNFKDTDGKTMSRSNAFDKLVKNQGHLDPELSGRQAHFNEIFTALEAEGIDRDELYLAWDFNTMSHESLHGPMLQGRDLIVDALDGNPPQMTVDSFTEWQRDDPDASQYNAFWQYEIYGYFTAPQIVRPEGALGYVFNKDDDGNLAIYEEKEREFWVRIPYEVVENPSESVQMIQYGHGLLGKGNQVRGEAFGRTSGEYRNIYFGGNWTGMSSPDEARVGAIVSDFSNFRWLSDNMHQGILEFLVLADAMKHTFSTLGEIKDKEDNDLGFDVSTLNLHEEILYHGISQGGIYGPTYLAISPDIDVGALGVPGINYNFLVQRSIDFDQFMAIALIAYNNDPSKVALVLAAIQSLWDMTDPASYYKHLINEPFPGNNEKHVLLQPAKGDHQVSPLTNLIVANSGVGVKVMNGWGVDITHMGPNLQEQEYVTDGVPYKGSGIVLWGFGNPWPAPGMIPPQEEKALDPHGTPRYIHEHQEQMMHFLQTGGEIKDVCAGKSCFMDPLSTESIGDDPSECDQYKTDVLGVPAQTSDRQCYVLLE